MPKIYSDEFKRDAVAMVAAGSSQKKVCRDLGISKTALQTWVRDDRFRSQGMTPSTDPGERREMTATIRRTLISVPARLARSARRITLHLPAAWPWQSAFERLFTATHAPPTVAAN